MIAYKLTRNDDGTWMYCGTEPEGPLHCLRAEMEAEFELPLEERSEFHIVPFEITQEEIDNMPEFPGW